MTSVFYDQRAIEDLIDRTSYEIWLLEAIYKLVEEELFPTFPDCVIYPLGHPHPKFYVYARGNFVIGDWRPSFLEAGAPLVFTSTFKLLDMLLEWILERNGIKSSYRFSEKIQKLDGPLVYPEFIEIRPWLKDRLRSLYEALEPLRGTIIHSRHFASTDGTLRVSSSKRGNIGPEVEISAQTLRTFAVLCVSILRYVQRIWLDNPHKEMQLRWQLDQLSQLHKMPKLGQKEPYVTTVRVFLAGNDPRAVDVTQIRKDLEMHYPQLSPIFDLRAVLVQGGSVISAYLFPWSVLNDLGKLADVSKYKVAVPQDLDPQHYDAHPAT